MVKFLVAGDVQGRFSALQARVVQVNATRAGPFAFVLCAGDVFGSDDGDLPRVVSGEVAFPIPVYFVCTRAPKSLDLGRERKQLAPNLEYLGASGHTSVHGLSVAFLSGIYDPSRFASDAAAPSPAQHVAQAQQEVRSMLGNASAAGYRGVDVLLTCERPEGVHRLLSPPAAAAARDGPCSPLSAALAAVLQPRYHFAGSGASLLQRAPYRNTRPSGAVARFATDTCGVSLDTVPRATHVTRLISLCCVDPGADKSRKWIHALGLVPLEEMDATVLAKEPPQTTDSPFTESAEAVETVAAQGGAAPVAPAGAVPMPAPAEVPGAADAPPAKRARRPGDGALAAPTPAAGGGSGLTRERMRELEKEGEEASLRGGGGQFFYRLPQRVLRGRGRGRGGRGGRGGQVDNPNVRVRTNCWFCMSSPDFERHLVASVGEESYLAMPKGGLIADHVLIIPIEHAPSTLALSASARAEMERYRDALAACFAKQGKKLIVWERHITTRSGGHMHWQVLPVPDDKAAEAKETFAAAFKRLGVPVEEESAATPLVEAVGDSKGHYINLELPCGTRLLHRIQPEERRRYHIQFVREIAASLLGMPERADWKVCAMDTAGETQVANRFKNLFKPFDWNLQQ